MKNIAYYLFALTFVFTLGSCTKKDGLADPNENKGQQGIVGAVGNMLRYASGPPSPSLGSNGDFYIDKEANVLYGPKNSNGWDTGISLVGPSGKDYLGPHFSSGINDPSKDHGAIGDFYFNLAAVKLFGPKNGSGWGAGISLIGPQGPMGAANIKKSDWITIPEWIFSVWNDNYKMSVYSFPTSLGNVFDFLNTEGGMMLVYGRDQASGIIQPYPIVFRNIDNDKDYRMSWEVHSDNKLHLLVSGSYGEQIVRTSFGYEQFRYVLVPSGVSLSSIGKNASEVDWSKVDYDQLKQLLDFED